jgi:8-oxo-dGTP pyrophosphatase MutT (NUDIX family)
MPMDIAMPELPDDLPILEREAVRLVVQDTRGDVLLFWTNELTAPELGHWWELPGGGMEPGESYAHAAVRELQEEAGIIVAPERIGPATWRRIASFRHRNVRHLQRELIALVRLDAEAPELDTSARLDYETEDYTDHRWWPVSDIIAGRDRFYPGRLPELLPALLAGEEVDEPFELFS